MTGDPIRTLAPVDSKIEGTNPTVRIIHQDPRGFLMETLRQDDARLGGSSFAMSYVSMTLPGKFRDADQWHVHQEQTDRFFVPLGQLILALYDARPDSTTFDRLEALQMDGAAWNGTEPSEKHDLGTSVVSIPPGVYHCLGNVSRSPSLLVNFPTRLYSPADEGRVPFAAVHPSGNGPPFAWSRVVPGPGQR